MTKTIKCDKDGKIDLKEFDDLLDISLVEYYSIKRKGKKFYLVFYNKEKEVIKLFVR